MSQLVSFQQRVWLEIIDSLAHVPRLDDPGEYADKDGEDKNNISPHNWNEAVGCLLDRSKLMILGARERYNITMKLNYTAEICGR